MNNLNHLLEVFDPTIYLVHDISFEDFPQCTTNSLCLRVVRAG